MLNKQSFSANPRDLKKSSSNQTGSDGTATGNFLSILNQYTQEQDNHLTLQQLKLEKMALIKEKEA
jgi:hypothetical protein